MRSFFEPTAAPSWLRQVLSSIRAALGDIWPAPLRLKDYADADLPAAADFAQGLAWNATRLTITWSDGTRWTEPQPLIAAGSSAQYWRGDKSWQALNAAAVANSPAGNIAATNVQAALNELDGEKLAAANNFSDLASATAARTNLGLGTMAVQAATSVAITGGQISGLAQFGVAGIATQTAAFIIGNGGGRLFVDLSGAGDNYLDGTNTYVRTNAGGATIARFSSGGLALSGGSVSGLASLVTASNLGGFIQVGSYGGSGTAAYVQPVSTASSLSLQTPSGAVALELNNTSKIFYTTGGAPSFTLTNSGATLAVPMTLSAGTSGATNYLNANLTDSAVGAGNKTGLRLLELGSMVGELTIVRDGTPNQIWLNTISGGSVTIGVNGSNVARFAGSGASIAGSLDLGGALSLGAGTFTANVGKLYRDATNGTVLSGHAGSTYDMVIASASGNHAITIAHGASDPILRDTVTFLTTGMSVAPPSGASQCTLSFNFTGDNFAIGRTGPSWSPLFGWLGANQNYIYVSANMRVGNSLGYVEFGGPNTLFSGSIGLGEDAPAAKLDVQQDSDSNTNGIRIARANETDAMFLYMSAGGYSGLQDSLNFHSSFTGGVVAAIDRAGHAVFSGSARVGAYTVAGAPSAATYGAGAIIYVSDESGGAVLAFSDGTSWRRVTDRAVIS